MKKRPDGSSMLMAFTGLFCFATIVLFCVAIAVSADGGYAEVWWTMFFGCLISFLAMFIINGFHNVLLDIRDQMYEQTAMLKTIRNVTDGGETEREEAAAEQEKLNRWKDRWYRKIEKSILGNGITNDFGAYLQAKILQLETVPKNENDWYSKMLSSYQEEADKEQSLSDGDSALEKWKADECALIDDSVTFGVISESVGKDLKNKVTKTVMVNYFITKDLKDDSGLPKYIQAAAKLSTAEEAEASELVKWKDSYIQKVNISLRAGKISEEKANVIIKKVQACTEIPKSQK